MKLAVIGGSSYYTPHLIEALNESGLNVEVVLNGRTEDKLNDVTKVCSYLATEKIKVTSTTNLQEALDGADFVLQQARIGGMQKRAKDERFPLNLGLVGEETIVPGGASLAVRTLPYLEEFAQNLKLVAPRAKVLALTNPNNMVIDYLNRYLGVEAIGFCDLPTSLIKGVVKALTGKDEEISAIWPKISFKYYGLNHLAFLGELNYQGRDIDIVHLAPKLGLDPLLIETLGLLPVAYLRYFYYTTVNYNKAKASPTRGEVLSKNEAKLQAEYKKSTGEKPKALQERAVPWYKDVVVPFLKATRGQTKAIVVTKNQGVLDDLSPDSIAEIPVVVKNGELTRIRQGKIPEVIRGLIVSVSSSERLIVDGIANRSKGIFRQGLLSHPLIREIEKAEAVLWEIKRINQISWL